MSRLRRNDLKFSLGQHIDERRVLSSFSNQCYFKLPSVIPPPWSCLISIDVFQRANSLTENVSNEGPNRAPVLSLFCSVHYIWYFKGKNCLGFPLLMPLLCIKAISIRFLKFLFDSLLSKILCLGNNTKFQNQNQIKHFLVDSVDSKQS